MRDDRLAVNCPAREPDVVLLAQLTALAAASTTPAVKPWWQRFTVKAGAAAVAGVLLISGATADAEHATPAPIAVTIVGTTTDGHATPRHKRVHATTPHLSPVVSAGVFSRVRHAGKKAPHQRRHARNKKHQNGNSNGGGSENKQGGTPPAVVAASPLLASGRSHSHAHSRQRANSPH